MEIISENVYKVYKVKEKAFKYKKLEVVSNFNYKIEQGEIIALLGVSNSGKSTIVKLLSGEETPTSGKILINGKIDYKSLKKNSEILNDFRKRKLLTNESIYNNLVYYGNKLKIDSNDIEKRIVELRDVLELDKIINKKIFEISSLDLMKLNIAISMLKNPSIIYFDDALTQVDTIEKNTLLKLLKRLNKEFKTTIVIASTNILDVEKICKRVTILKNGKIIADDKYEIIKNKLLNNKILNVTFNKSYNIPKGNFEILENNDYYLKVKIDFSQFDFASFINQFDINTIIDINISPIALETL